MGSSGIEPPTSRLSGARSNQLSYEPITLAVSSFAISSFFQTLWLFPFPLLALLFVTENVSLLLTLTQDALEVGNSDWR